ncbi:MAG: hypothetical protein PHF29_01095 [Candidatus Riflebacteria bacterium]|nr:hypothetical protein [Candidatus Riflebacteria bacterium]
MLFQLLRSLLVLTGTITGVAFGYAVASDYPEIVELENPELTFAVLLGFIGYLIFSITGRGLQEWIEKQIDQTNSSDLAWSALGFVLGLLCANLLLIPFYIIIFNGMGSMNFENRYLNSVVPLFNLTLPLGFNLLLAYLGVRITIRYRKYQNRIHFDGVCAKSKLVDTSAVTDGRFVDLYRLGFLEGNIIIPKFVMNELHLISNSDEKLKADRGKKALEMLKSLKSDFPDNISIIEKDFPEIPEIEMRIIKLAIELKATLVTQDANMKRIAGIENVVSININDLANALKPVFISGEDLEIKITKKGKEAHQGVGFLSDGTMVVIEDGGEYVGKTVKTRVSNILQTGAGRMVFCRIGINNAEGTEE